MKDIINTIVGLIFIISYIAGIVIAKGFWSTTFAIILFPYSWYLVIEKIMLYYRVI